MPEETKLDRRRFLRDAAMTIAAAEFGINGFADAQSNKKPLAKTWEGRRLRLRAEPSICRDGRKETFSPAGTLIGHYERVLPMLVEPAR